MYRTGLSFGRSAALAAVGAAFCAAMLFRPAVAEAKGFVLITYGDDISKVADIPADQLEGVKQDTGASNPAIGYKYSMFGIFFLNIWTWSGEYVLYEDDNYWDLGTEGAAQILGTAPDQLKKPLGYTIPPGLVLILVLIIGGVVWKLVLSKGGSSSSSDSSMMEKAKAEAAAAAGAPGAAAAAAASADDADGEEDDYDGEEDDYDDGEDDDDGEDKHDK